MVAAGRASLSSDNSYYQYFDLMSEKLLSVNSVFTSKPQNFTSSISVLSLQKCSGLEEIAESLQTELEEAQDTIEQLKDELARMEARKGQGQL